MDLGFSTIDAGAGSYPTPPDIPNQEQPECEECYETTALRMTDGHLLCPKCRAEYIFQNTDHNDRMNFINSGSVDDRKDFYLTFYFDGLGSRERLKVAELYFEKCVPAHEKEFLTKLYTEELKSDFAEYMDKAVRKRGF